MCVSGGRGFQELSCQVEAKPELREPSAKSGCFAMSGDLLLHGGTEALPRCFQSDLRLGRSKRDPPEAAVHFSLAAWAFSRLHGVSRTRLQLGPTDTTRRLAAPSATKSTVSSKRTEASQQQTSALSGSLACDEDNEDDDDDDDDADDDDDDDDLLLCRLPFVVVLAESRLSLTCLFACVLPLSDFRARATFEGKERRSTKATGGSEGAADPKLLLRWGTKPVTSRLCTGGRERKQTAEVRPSEVISMIMIMPT